MPVAPTRDLFATLVDTLKTHHLPNPVPDPVPANMLLASEVARLEGDPAEAIEYAVANQGTGVLLMVGFDLERGQTRLADSRAARGVLPVAVAIVHTLYGIPEQESVPWRLDDWQDAVRSEVEALDTDAAGVENVVWSSTRILSGGENWLGRLVVFDVSKLIRA